MQGEELPIVLIVALGASALLFGFEVDRRRRRLHAIFDTFDREESQIATYLESLVENGRLKPYIPGSAI